MNSKNNSTAKYKQQLLGIRDAISEIDNSLISLLAKRRKLSINVADIKQAIDKPLRDQIREKELLESLVEKASLLNIESRYITRIFTAIIEDSVRYQQEYVQAKITPSTKNNLSKSVAVLGGVGAYSHLAAKQFFAKSDNQYDACDSFDEIIQKVERGVTEYGVIPIENTTSGGITEVYDLLLNSKLQIVGEEKLPINHCLVTKKQLELTQIRTIVAHPQAARQCSQDLEKITKARISLCESTAHALATVAAEENSDSAAIASEQAAELFDLQVLKKNITNQERNYTRFMVLAKNAIPVALTVPSKTTIALSTGQQPGSLAKVLALFENANIPLSKLESRPIPEKPWEQLFYIDLQGNIDEPHVAETLASLSSLCKFLKIFGSYPSENIIATKVSADSVAHASLKRAELNTTSATPTSPPKLVDDAELSKSLMRISPSKTLQESIVDLNGTLIGKNSFVLSAIIHDLSSEHDLEELFNSIAECGLSSCWITNLRNLQTDKSRNSLDEHSISRVVSLAKQNQLSLILDIASAEQLVLVLANKGIPRIAVSKLEQLDLLDSVGNQTSPVIIQQPQSDNYEKLLNAAEYILRKGNQQVVLELALDYSKYTPSNLASIAKLKNLTHLPLIIHLVGDKIDLRVLPILVSGIRDLGVNGVLLDLTDKNQNHESDEQLMITAKELATIMTKI
jgi:chorismate mutase / prephenate dehydratase